MKNHLLRAGYLLSAIAVYCALAAVCVAQQVAAPKPAQAAKEWPKDKVGGLIAEWTRAKNWTAEPLVLGRRHRPARHWRADRPRHIGPECGWRPENQLSLDERTAW